MFDHQVVQVWFSLALVPSDGTEAVDMDTAKVSYSLTTLSVTHFSIFFLTGVCKIAF